MSLYHYTCDDGLQGIIASGWTLKPGPLGLVWLTDMVVVERDALGLTSHILSCDRTRHRLTVEATEDVYHWPRWCKQAGITRAERDLLELVPGAAPMRWFVTDKPIRCERPE